jgi:hypothetical protein
MGQLVIVDVQLLDLLLRLDFHFALGAWLK